MQIENKPNVAMSPVEFIKGTLIGNLGSMLPSESGGYPYELYILIAVGIEFLGACEDNLEWHTEERGWSKTRFMTGLDLFPTEYHRHKEFLYKKLRCGMAHTFAPAGGLGISENKWGAGNLIGKVYAGQTIQLQLNVESFYADFKRACEKIITKIENQEFPKGNKIYHTFLWVPTNEPKT